MKLRFPALAALLTGTLIAVPYIGADVADGAIVPKREVTFVGNNWAGTASIIDTHTHKTLKSGIDLVPDKAAELAAIKSDPVRLAYYLIIQQGPGEGHDQFVDDMFTTTDGKYLAVSRPSLGDVVWIDIAKAAAGRTDSIVREQSMDGNRTDHMAVSPNGKRLLVSDSTAKQVIEYSMVNEATTGVKMGDRLRTFPSGETPHESQYTAGGGTILHASIGKVYTPGDDPLLDATKGERVFQAVRNSDFKVMRRWNIGKELAEAGHPKMSAAVRPMAISPDGRFVYFQVSFFHGIVEFDLGATDINHHSDYKIGGMPEPSTGRVTRLFTLPNRIPNVSREKYVNDSAHHGLSMDETGTTLCAAGTMDDYVALVDRATGTPTFFDETTTGHTYGKPYWTTEGPDNTCWVSLSESDSIAIIDVATKKEIAWLPVGDHPQRIRHGLVTEDTVASWSH